MKFTSTENLVFVKARNFKSSKGNDCTFVTLANPSTYESIDVMPVKGCDLSRFAEGEKVSAVLHYDGRYTNVELLPASSK